MATGRLGKTARISYEAKNQKTGLLDITVKIRKPNDTILGPFQMTEYELGFYKYDFATALNDLEGDYLCLIQSPTQNIKAQVKLSLFLAETGSGGTSPALSESYLIAYVTPDDLRAEIGSSVDLTALVDDTELMGIVQNESHLIGFLSASNLIGEIQECCNG